jgi:SAM-dependent methyltransferase
VADIYANEIEPEFDLVYVRFLLTHLPDPDSALRRIREALRPEGIIIVVDIDFRGYFCYPESLAFNRYIELYSETVQRRGGDPNIGPRLPELLARNGFERIQMNVVQPAGLDGEVKLITPLTMENIADAVFAEGLATREEIEKLVRELYDYARTAGTIGSTPRIVEAWGRKSE